MTLSAIASSPAAQWQPLAAAPLSGQGADLALTGRVISDGFLGFGACFNELGWQALSRAGGNARQEALGRLFGPGQGCDFSYCRLPMGANDFARSWYSYCETPGDFALESFSVARDEEGVLPFLRAAQALRPDPIRLFASPWSPPTWLKFPAVYNYGHLIAEPRYLQTYAAYFVKYLQAYAALGFDVGAVHVQNEPDSDQKFPSCRWTGAELAEFIGSYLGPAFAAAGVSTEIWLGTIERGEFNAWVGRVMSDPAAARYVRGLGFQWAGKGAIQRSHQAFPDLPIIQTESECGDGKNDWPFAHYVFDLIHHYLTNGARSYVYWNMALPGDATGNAASTWGWKQNSLISVDMASGALSYNPEFWIMRHFGQFVRPGASVLELQGRMSANALCFRNPDGGLVMVVQNPLDRERSVRIADRAGAALTLPPASVTTVCIGATAL